MIWNGHEMVEDRSIKLPDITRELPIDWSTLVGSGYDSGAQTLACTGSACDL